MKKLDAEEQEILTAFEGGKLKRASNASAETKRHREAAVATFQKDSRIDIRISSKDLRMLQKRTLQEGLPYQTLISSLLHKYVEEGDWWNKASELKAARST
jgi:predicted DNA binding CopG/RHH family protein